MLYMLQSHYNNVIECSKHQFLSGRRAVRAVTSACFAETSACHAKADFLLVSSIRVPCYLARMVAIQAKTTERSVLLRDAGGGEGNPIEAIAANVACSLIH